jgi:hypothetical protein
MLELRASLSSDKTLDSACFQREGTAHDRQAQLQNARPAETG